MVEDAQIYRAASKLIDEHGCEAVSEAARLLSEVLSSRDKDGAAVVLRVRAATAVLRTTQNRLVH